VRPRRMQRWLLAVGVTVAAPLAGLMSGVDMAHATGEVDRAGLHTDHRATATDSTELAPVDVVEVSGLLDEILVNEITDSIDRAKTNGSQALVLQLNSRASVVSEERFVELLRQVAEASIPIGVWVGPSGARAYGAPAQLLAVADVTAMAPGARIGYTGTLKKLNDESVSFGAADDLLTNGSMGFLEARDQKVLKFSTDDRGVPVLRNMLFALDGLTVNGKQLDTVVDALDDNGQVVREATTARFFKLGLVPRLLHTVASPASAYLLISIGLALLIFELFTAGIGVAGLVGAVCTVLASIGMSYVPVNGTGLVLLLLAMVAFAVDVQVGVPRLWTGVGLVLYVISSFSLFESVGAHVMRPSWITLATCIGGMALTFIVGMPSMTRTRFATPTIGREWLIGREGVAVGAISPNGTVRIDGAEWRARTNRATPLVDAQGLRVVAIDGVTLEVEPLEGGARDYREMRKSGDTGSE
jgi:membrane-bound serine protease (ClpP class)